ncbi:MAG: helicase-related protein [Gammaproteobacteria bacterium]|nr:helicase-related protein [Gammaproteobacteria bacterium]
MAAAVDFAPGSLVRARGREWVVLPETRAEVLKLRPLGGADADATLIYLPLEPQPPTAATFDLPDPGKPGSQEGALLLRDALRLKLRAGAGPFRSFGNINVEPRAYQLVPLLMALKLDTVRLLIADDVGIGKTIEAGLIARELLDRAEIDRLCVICPPHLCEQWQQELAEKFAIGAEVVRPGTAARLERGLRPDESVFEVHPFTIVSLDYIKSDRRRDDFLRACPPFVIVDEAHTCVQANTNVRHQRYRLLKGLAESRPDRHMVLLTATPHSGDDTAFHNLLGLLEPRFGRLAEMPDGEERRALRVELSAHFVQRRRGDIAEWRDQAGFPARESRETTYRLSGEWGSLFDEILAYARTMVARAEGGTALQQRMSWWAALALLRCASSSPAAASQALRTRLRAAEGGSEEARVSELDRTAGESVLDTSDDDLLALDESVPAGIVDDTEDATSLRTLIDRADGLRGVARDPKLKTLVREVKELLAGGFQPVVFCRYIATAHYVGEALRAGLPSNRTHVEVVTGELTSDQREDRVDALEELADGIAPVLVATDCLSEGVNLQRHFDAVVHYDLTWNPTRHEQREGRADRFGQASPTVRTLMIYGRDNPVDGAVLRVILRKAERIRRELGIAVPLPTDNNKVVEAVMKAVLLHGASPQNTRQTTFDFGDIEAQVDDAWATARDKASGTVFAQRRLRPDDVLPEWRRTVSLLGGPEDVARFVRVAAERLGAPLDPHGNSYRLPVAHLPKPLQDQLDAIGVKSAARIAFEQPVPAGTTHIHRTHPIVATLADHIAEQALDADSPTVGARASAVFTPGVQIRTVLYMLRLRCHIQIERRGEGGQFEPRTSLLAEECLGVAVRGSNAPEPLSDDNALSLLDCETGRNMDVQQKARLIDQALAAVPALESAFDSLATERAHQLLADHRRVRAASDARGLRFNVVPTLPADVIGAYVFMPMATL